MRRFHALLRVALLLVLVATATLGAQAAPRAQEDPPSPALGELIAKAQAQGTLRVIALLRLPFQPEGALADDQTREQQRDSIAQVQDRVVSALNPARPAYQFTTVPYLALELDAAELAALGANPEVVSVVEDLPVPPTMDVSNPLIGAPTAWAAGATGAGQAVAVLDTGVDKNHPFLNGKVVSEACYSTTDGTYGSLSVCPGGVPESTDANSGLHCDLTVYGCNHGTHVAGTVAGNSLSVNNGGQTVSMSGVAPAASVIAVQVFSRFNSSTYCGNANPICALTFTTDQMKGLERVYELRNSYNVASVNMSLGGSRYTAACNGDSRKPLIDNLLSVGIATVIASGNSYYSDAVGAPACISSAITVGSTTVPSAGSTDQVSAFSNSATLVDLLAPGHYIYSSVPGTSYAYFAGTSMATPHVAGAWAVLKSAAPSASVANVLSALSSTGVSITAVRSGFPNITKPRIQLNSALNALFPAPASLSASGSVAGRIGLSWSQTNAYETSFKIERSPNGSSGWVEIGTASADATSYNDTSVTCATTYHYRVRAATSSVNSLYSNTDSASTGCAAPSIEVSGDGQPIGNGSTPSVANRTNFGDVIVGQSATHTFTINNAGTAALNLTGTPRVSISGAAAGDFSVTQQPASSVAAGGSTTFQLRFAPSVDGPLNATISIASSDGANSPYIFAVTGTGINTGPSPQRMIFSLPANAANGTTVGTFAANDLENNVKLTGGYVITAGNTGGVFAISDAGTLSVANAASLTAGSSFSLTVQVTDLGNLSGSNTITINVAKVNQTVTLSQPAAKTYGDAAFNIVASASSGLPVSLSSSTPSICSVSNTTVTLLGAGSCSLLASQTGNSTYNAAPETTLSFTVAKAALTIIAEDKLGQVGSTLPVLTVRYEGFVNSDAAASLDSLPTLSTTATSSSPAGSYEIVIAGAADANYVITFVKGTLTLQAAPGTPTKLYLPLLRR